MLGKYLRRDLSRLEQGRAPHVDTLGTSKRHQEQISGGEIPQEAEAQHHIKLGLCPQAEQPMRWKSSALVPYLMVGPCTILRDSGRFCMTSLENHYRPAAVPTQKKVFWKVFWKLFPHLSWQEKGGISVLPETHVHMHDQA